MLAQAMLSAAVRRPAGARRVPASFRLFFLLLLLIVAALPGCMSTQVRQRRGPTPGKPRGHVGQHRGPGRTGHRAVRRRRRRHGRNRARHGPKPRAGTSPGRAPAPGRRRHRAASPTSTCPTTPAPKPACGQLHLLNQAVSISILNYARPGALRNKHGKFDWTPGPRRGGTARGHRRGLRLVHLRPRQLHQRRARGDARDRLPAARRRHRRRRADRAGLAGRPAHRPGGLAQPAGRPDRRPARRSRRAAKPRATCSRASAYEAALSATVCVAGLRARPSRSPAAPRRRPMRDNAPGTSARSRAPTRTNSGTRWSAPSARLQRSPHAACATRRSTPTSRRRVLRGRPAIAGPARLHRGRAAVQREHGAERHDDRVDRRVAAHARRGRTGVRARPRSRPLPRAAHAAAMAAHEGHQRVPQRLPGARLRRGHARTPAMLRLARHLRGDLQVQPRHGTRGRPASASRRWSRRATIRTPASTVGAHAARREHATYDQPHHGVRHAPGDRRNASTTCAPRPPRCRIRRRNAQRGAVPRRDAALTSRHWLEAELARRRYASSHAGDQRTARRRAARMTWRAARSTSAKRIAAAMTPATTRRPPNCTHARSPCPARRPAAWREHGYALAHRAAAPKRAWPCRRYLQNAPQADDRAFVQRALDKLGGTH